MDFVVGVGWICENSPFSILGRFLAMARSRPRHGSIMAPGRGIIEEVASFFGSSTSSMLTAPRAARSPQTPSTPTPARWLSSALHATALVGAFLLFQVQPLLGKAVPPSFGGAAAVWTTVILFFQGA